MLFFLARGGSVRLTAQAGSWAATETAPRRTERTAVAFMLEMVDGGTKKW